MKKELMVIGIFVGFVVLSGCTSPPQNTDQIQEDLIIGKWNYEYQDVKMNFTFYKNHSACLEYKQQPSWMQYEITKDHLIFINPVNGNTTSNQYVFSANNQKLTLTDPKGELTVLTRQTETQGPRWHTDEILAFNLATNTSSGAHRNIFFYLPNSTSQWNITWHWITSNGSNSFSIYKGLVKDNIILDTITTYSGSKTYISDPLDKKPLYSVLLNSEGLCNFSMIFYW
jgi:hypothetical protein